MRVLIAEDDENSRLLLESILLSLGHGVDVAADGSEAIRLLHEHHPDLIITDILMPGIDGFELCRQVRADERLRGIPIIVYSATYVERRDKELALAAGANRFVIKPVEPVEMIRIIDEVAHEGAPVEDTQISDAALTALHVERLQAKLRRKLIQLGRERSALRSSEERLRLALEAADLGVFEWQLDNNQISGDSRVSQILIGRPLTLKMDWLDLSTHIHPDDRGELAGLKNRLLRQEDKHSIVCRFVHPDGQTHWIDLHVQRLPDDSFAAPPRAIGVAHDITREQALSERLHQTANHFDHLVRHDTLTGLPNRQLFNEMLQRTLQPPLGEAQECAVLLLDLDSFKVINDSLGHEVGDTLLVRLSERIQASLRPIDLVARIGSDEFAVIVPSPRDREEVASLARKLLYALAEPIEIGSERLTITASIGIAYTPDDGHNHNILLKAADTAVYVAKAQGKNRLCFHTADMTQRANELHSIEQGLKRALEQGHLRVHYQPQINLANGELIGVEALVRWQHPTEGLIPPGRFIPVAENSGLIEHLGRWVLRAACAECLPWLSNYPAQFRLSVNLSARQLVDEQFPESLRAILLETGFPAAQLELELTESTLQLVETSPRLLNEIKSLGVSLAIDDFGTGYSSLSVLKTLPIDRLKIDQSFVRDMPGDTNDIAIVEAIIGISRTLGLSIIAEGVETEAQLAILQQLGCEAGQGYLFSRPLPPDDLNAWLQNRHLPGR